MISFLNFRKSGTRRFSLCDTGVLCVREISTVFSLEGRGKLGTFRDTVEDEIGSDDSDISWVDDVVDGTMDSMEQL